MSKSSYGRDLKRTFDSTKGIKTVAIMDSFGMEEAFPHLGYEK